MQGTITAGIEVCSPQVRGCSHTSASGLVRCQVFPAGAGVFLSSYWQGKGAGSVPRRCGGVPRAGDVIDEQDLCSPQVRGCSFRCPVSGRAGSVFPAGAGVFPEAQNARRQRVSVPRRCGGVPTDRSSRTWTARCSPQVRGCSWPCRLLRSGPGVFPAGAGVFLWSCV